MLNSHLDCESKDIVKLSQTKLQYLPADNTLIKSLQKQIEMQDKA